MDLGLNGKHALVCASSEGLGYAAAEALAQEGSAVFLCGRNLEKLEIAAKKLQRFDVNVGFAKVDLTTADGVSDLIELAKTHLGQIDILVNNVGGPIPTAAKDTSSEQWQAGFEQLFLSAQRLTNAFLPAMCESGYGRVINITSMSVVEPIENLAVSTAMRAALTANTKTLAREVAGKGVTLNSVMPGVIHTGRIEFLRQKKAERDGTSLAAEMQATRQSIPAGRLGKPEEVGALIAFLASQQASYITGQNIAVDGGLIKSW